MDNVHPMNVLLLCNPTSGGGKSLAARGAVARALVSAGHHVTERATEPGESASAALQAALSQQDVLVVMGGDGSVRGASHAAMRASVPVYVLPYGTENLFARHHGFTRGIDQLLASLRSRCVSTLDVCEANGQRFLIMASVGFDADVVAEVAAHRTGAISKFSYAMPIIRTAATWRGHAMTVECDGGPPRAVPPGTLVVANMPEYAARLDPVPSAVATDGRLDGLALPGRTALGMAVAVACCWLRATKLLPTAVRLGGRELRIRGSQPFRFQLDGDPPASALPVCELVLRVVEGGLQVWQPVQQGGG